MFKLERGPQEPAVFLQSFELTKLVFKSTQGFPKPSRYVLGRQLEEKALVFVLLLNKLVGPSGVRFLKIERRLQLLEELSSVLDEFRILLRMARETGAYSAGQYRDFSSLVQSIGRQIGGMMRQLRKGEKARGHFE